VSGTSVAKSQTMTEREADLNLWIHRVTARGRYILADGDGVPVASAQARSLKDQQPCV
jgi:hypothetical protein